VKDTVRSRFRVVGQLGRGALADVYLCRLQGVAGFEKEVVVKRIIAEHAADPLFVRMFLDEARVVAKLTHANIVQVFEAGVEDGAPYIAMEYVRGVNLSMIIGRAHKDGKIHHGHFANIVSGICEGLDYAHAALDQDGEALAIVHRDVKPANIVVSMEGVPKLLEFGMATAKGRLSHAESGSFRGKLRYMAPEQISQGQIDHRADVYGLGVTLYELTTGRNPFGAEGDPEVEVLDRVLSGVFPRPSQIVAGYPPELESIVLSAIERDVHKRCASARDLREQLSAFMATPEHLSNQRALAGWLRRLFPDFATLSKAGAIAGLIGPPISDPQTEEARRPPPYPQNGGSVPGEDVGPPPATSSRAFLTSDAGQGPSLQMALRKRNRGGRWAAIATTVVALAVAVWWLELRQSPPTAVAPSPPATATVPAGKEPRQAATAYLDAAETFINEKRFEPAADMVTKAGDLKLDDPALTARMVHLRDRIVHEMSLAKATDRPQRRTPDSPRIEPLANQYDDTPPAGLASARSAAPLRAAPGRRKARGRDGTSGLATDRRMSGRLKDELLPRSPAAARRRQALVSEPAVPTSPENVAVASEKKTSLPPPPPSPAHPAPLAQASAPPAVSPPISQGTNHQSPAAPPSNAPHQARPAAPGGAPPATSSAPVPAPSLPRVYVTEDSERLARVCQQVESAVISLAGVRPDYARGITTQLRRQVRPNTPIYPMAMYYFVIREAAQKRDRATAAANLAAAHASGLIRQSSGP
jgi:serine/threonine protein kinase